MLVERECVFCTFSFLYEINLGELRFFEWFIRNTSVATIQKRGVICTIREKNMKKW